MFDDLGDSNSVRMKCCNDTDGIEVVRECFGRMRLAQTYSVHNSTRGPAMPDKTSGKLP